MSKAALVIMAAESAADLEEELSSWNRSGQMGNYYGLFHPDAVEAGFDKVIFVIRKDLEKDFKEVIETELKNRFQWSTLFRSSTIFRKHSGRNSRKDKAVGHGAGDLACRGKVTEPFLVINADDFYGKEAYAEAYQYLKENRENTGKEPICMVGFVLKNTLSENGGVTRGVCEVDENGMLTNIIETHNIVRNGDHAEAEDGAKRLELEAPVSMNMWGLQPEFLNILEKGFQEFLEKTDAKDLKAEYLLLPSLADFLRMDRLKSLCCSPRDKWFGVTYKEDKESVVNAIKE